MALRRIDIFEASDVNERLGEREVDVLERYTWQDSDGQQITSLVIQENDVETLLKIGGEREDDREDPQWRVIISPVLATLPQEVKSPSEESKQNRWQCERVSRDELMHELEPGGRLNLNDIIHVVVSSVVATAGLARDDVAVVIAAMVIAPLLRPSMSLSLATTLGDQALLKTSLKTSGTGILVALFSSLALALLIPLDPDSEQLTRRAGLTVLDAIIATAAGAAGALAVTSGLSAAMIGVMVAVALLPPTSAVGIFLALGDWASAAAAAGLTMTNIACVNLSGVAVFWALRIRPGTWYDETRARRARMIALACWAVTAAIIIGVAWILNP